ncbi:MAG TPA: ribonuclease R, partial [Rhodanobacteraceae bacterium]|nr:ribonuclease R [Rhodanobacteraceae bacterium]
MTTRKRSKPQAGDRRRPDPHAGREAERYARPIPSREAILAMLAESGQLMKAAAVAAALGLEDEQDLEALDKRLAAMVRDGQLLKNRRDGFGVASRLDLIAGEVLANSDGYGFLRPDEGGD